MVFDTVTHTYTHPTTHPPTHTHTHTHTHSFYVTNIGYPKPRGLGYNSEFTKPRACIFEPRAVNVPNQVLTLNQSMATSFHKRIP